MNTNVLLSATLLLIGFCLGCADQKKPPDQVQQHNQQANHNEQADPEPEPNPPEQKEPVEAQSIAPDAAVRMVIQQLQNNQLTGVWEFLPASYQQDVNQLVHEWADQIPEQRWNQVFDILQNSLTLLQGKKTFILDTQKSPAAISEQQYDEMVILLEDLLKGELANLAAVKKLDVGNFLKNSGGEFLQRLSKLSELSPDNPWQNARKQWDDLKIEVLDADANNAMLLFSLQQDPDSRQRVPFIKVEGKWIPLALASGWESLLDNLRKQSLSTVEDPREQKLDANLSKLLDELNRQILQLQSAKTADEFTNLIRQNQQSLLALLNERQKLLSIEDPDPQTAPAEKKSVKIIVALALDEKAERLLIDELLPLADDPNLAIATVQRDKNQTRITLSPVNQFSRFTKRITFTKVSASDAETNTITLTWPPATNETKPQ